MRISQQKLIKVKSIFDPNIKTIKQAVLECGKTRQYIEKQDLTWGIVLSDEKSGDIGTKVIIKDEKYDSFIEKYIKA